MFNFSKASSLVLGLAVVAGLGLSSLASANMPTAELHGHASHLLVEGGADRLQQNRVAEGGADRLHEQGLAEGGADRLQAMHTA
jgi:hypothetical protein